MRESEDNQRELLNLGEAWIAVAQFNGPIDPALVKLKHDSNVREAREKRELESNPLSPLHAKEDTKERERKDRDHQQLTLTALLASNAAYKAAWDKAMDGLPQLGAAMDDFQDKIDALLAGEKVLLKADLERVAARLPNGRYVFKGADGSIVGEDLKPLEGDDAEAAKDADFTGKMTLEEYRDRKGKIDRLETMADENRRGRIEIADVHAKLTDKKNPAQTEQEVQELEARKEAEKGLFEERVMALEKETLDRKQAVSAELGDTAEIGTVASTEVAITKPAF